MALNFPASPSNNQVYFDAVSGGRYTYNAVNNVWFFTANNAIQGNAQDAQVIFDDAGSANGNPGLTFNKTANTLTANTINAFSMRVTGNLYIGSNTVTITNDAIMAQSFFIMDNGTPVAVPTGTTSNASYSVANSAFAHTNTTLTHSQAVYAAVNSVFGVANAAFGSANNVAPQVAPAYNTANDAYTVSNSAYGFANGVATNAAAAFAAANNVAPQVTPAFNTANAAYTLANTKYSSSGGTISGNVSIVGDLNVRGNTYFVDQQTLVIGDPLIYLAGNNYTSDVVDIGFIANYVNTSSINVHTGLFRSAGTKEYYLFQGYDKEPANNYIDPTGNNITRAVLNSDVRTSNLNLGGANAITWISSGYGVANAAYGQANTLATSANAYASAVGTSANAYTVSYAATITNAAAAFAFANGVATNTTAAFAKANNALANVDQTVFNGNLRASYTISTPGFYENDANITMNLTISTGRNAFSAGPIAIANNIYVTIPDGSYWSVT